MKNRDNKEPSIWFDGEEIPLLKDSRFGCGVNANMELAIIKQLLFSANIKIEVTKDYNNTINIKSSFPTVEQYAQWLDLVEESKIEH